MAIDSLLVFGATGTQGHPVVEAALQSGMQVRAATRDPDAAAEKLPGRVERVYADLLEADSVAEAMRDVDAVFFHLPMMPDLPEAERVIEHIAAAAAEQGLERIVFTTAAYSGDDMPPGPFVDSLRDLSERLIGGAVPAVVLRPTLYLANLVWPSIIREIREFGRLSYPPFGVERRLSWTGTEDQGRIAIACLRAGIADEVLDIASPEPLTGPELCRYLAQVYEREVHYAPHDIDTFADDMSHFSGSAHVGRMLAGLYEGIASLDDGPVVDTDALQKRLEVELMPVGRWVRSRLGFLLSLYG